MILLTRRAALILSVAIVLLPLSIIVFRLELVVAVLTIIMLILLDIICFYMRIKRIRLIRVYRSQVPNKVIVGSIIDMKLSVEVNKYRGLLYVADKVPEGLSIIEGSYKRIFYSNGEETIELKYVVKALVRGNYTIGPAKIVLLSPLGLCGKSLGELRETRTYFKVVPQFYALRFKKSSAIIKYAKPPGGHPIKARGMGVELEYIREYMPGDDFRKIAWKISARNTLRELMVKETMSEVRLELFIVIDAGIESSLGYPQRLIDYYIEATGSLILVALDKGDVVGLYIAGTPSLLIPPTRRREYLYTALNIIETLNPSNNRTILHRVPSAIASILPKPSTVIFFFTSLENVLDPGNMVDKLRSIGYNVVFFIPYTPSFIAPKPGYKKLEKVYNYIIKKEKDRLERMKYILLSHGAKVVMVSKEDFIERVLREYYTMREYV